MESMYTLAIYIHFYSVVGFFLVALFNLYQLNSIKDVHIYAKKMRIFMPISSTFITVLMLTGAVMMAAKHLNFSWQNIVMILYSIVLVVLEIQRYVTLKHLNLEADNAFGRYKQKANKILLLHVSFIIIISGLMYI